MRSAYLCALVEVKINHFSLVLQSTLLPLPGERPVAQQKEPSEEIKNKFLWAHLHNSIFTLWIMLSLLRCDLAHFNRFNRIQLNQSPRRRLLYFT